MDKRNIANTLFVNVSCESHMINANGLFAWKLTIHLQNKCFKIVTAMEKRVNWTELSEHEAEGHITGHLGLAAASGKLISLAIDIYGRIRH